MRFLLVIPKFVRQMGQYYDFPLGFAYVSAVLKKAGYVVECLNLNHHDGSEYDILRKVITDRQIDVLCTGGLSVHYRKIKLILDVARQIKPEIITVVGGGIISSEPELMFTALEASFGIVGEGEQTIVELADALVNSKPYQKIDGLIYSDKERVVINQERLPIDDLDSLPYPDYQGFGIDVYLDMQMVNDSIYMYPTHKPRMLPIISSRSCPFNCTFCYHPIGKKYRQRSLDNFFNELEYLISQYQLNIVIIVDELFSFDSVRTHEFCARIKKFNIKWVAQMRVDGVDEETLAMLKDAGCICLSYGLESASDTILKSMKKHITIEQIEKALTLTRKAQIGIQGGFIFGDVADTWETAHETLNWYKDHSEYQILLVTLGVYPGSEVYKYAVEKGLIIDRTKFIGDGCPIINISQMSDAQFNEIVHQTEKAMREYAMFGKIFSCEKIEDSSLKGEIFHLKVECPHCHHTNEHSHFNLLENQYFIRIACRNCNQRFSLPTLIFDNGFKRKFLEIFKHTEPSRVAIFGASDFTKFRILPLIAQMGHRVACILDNNKLKHGIRIQDVEVLHFSDDSAIKSRLDAIVISAPEFEDEIYRQISYLEEQGITIYKLCTK